MPVYNAQICRTGSLSAPWGRACFEAFQAGQCKWCNKSVSVIFIMYNLYYVFIYYIGLYTCYNQTPLRKGNV